ncbi:hypothetical protein GQ42DRAFT_54754 [Ramicandelaber brevisporus]|nr:hypothetical protein GQ42DRAFT_54754 [Ramicandelaber brevisporus]
MNGLSSSSSEIGKSSAIFDVVSDNGSDNDNDNGGSEDEALSSPSRQASSRVNGKNDLVSQYRSCFEFCHAIEHHIDLLSGFGERVDGDACTTVTSCTPNATVSPNEPRRRPPRSDKGSGLLVQGLRKLLVMVKTELKHLEKHIDPVAVESIVTSVNNSTEADTGSSQQVQQIHGGLASMSLSSSSASSNGSAPMSMFARSENSNTPYWLGVWRSYLRELLTKGPACLTGLFVTKSYDAPVELKSARSRANRCLPLSPSLVEKLSPQQLPSDTVESPSSTKKKSEAAKTRVDIVTDNNATWIKVCAKPVASFFTTLAVLEGERDDSSDEDEVDSDEEDKDDEQDGQPRIRMSTIARLPIIASARALVTAARQHPHHYRTPTVRMLFEPPQQPAAGAASAPSSSSHSNSDNDSGGSDDDEQPSRPDYSAAITALDSQFEKVLARIGVEMGYLPSFGEFDRTKLFAPIHERDLPSHPEARFADRAAFSLSTAAEIAKSVQDGVFVGVNGLCALCSGLTHSTTALSPAASINGGRSVDELKSSLKFALLDPPDQCYFRSRNIRVQLRQEGEFPVLPWLVQLCRGRKIMTTWPALERFAEVVYVVAGPTERRRAATMLKAGDETPQTADYVKRAVLIMYTGSADGDDKDVDIDELEKKHEKRVELRDDELDLSLDHDSLWAVWRTLSETSGTGGTEDEAAINHNGPVVYVVAEDMSQRFIDFKRDNNVGVLRSIISDKLQQAKDSNNGDSSKEHVKYKELFPPQTTSELPTSPQPQEKKQKQQFGKKRSVNTRSHPCRVTTLHTSVFGTADKRHATVITANAAGARFLRESAGFKDLSVAEHKPRSLAEVRIRAAIKIAKTGIPVINTTE